MNTGTATINFGAFPGASDASVAVTGQTGILSGSFVEAWITPATTADHSPDEHWVESIVVVAGNIIAGTGFTIYARINNAMSEPVFIKPPATNIVVGTAAAVKTAQPGAVSDQGGNAPLLYGAWNVSWVWV